MSDAPPKQALPRWIDPRKFAQQGVDLAGEIPVSALSRMVDVLVDDTGVADVNVAFGVDEVGARTLAGAIDCRVSMLCERCLEAVAVQLHCDLNLAIVRDEEDAKRLPRYKDPWILAQEGTADLYEVLEEELLLALPMVAYHDTDCIDPSLLSSRSEDDDGAEPEAAESNPFKVLEQLKGPPKS